MAICPYYNIRGLEAGKFQCTSRACSNKDMIAGTADSNWESVSWYCQNNASYKGKGKKGIFGRLPYCPHHPNPQR
ncbi:MAG: hypothetical protein R3Y29_04995 [bacterium]